MSNDVEVEEYSRAGAGVVVWRRSFVLCRQGAAVVLRRAHVGEVPVPATHHESYFTSAFNIVVRQKYQTNSYTQSQRMVLPARRVKCGGSKLLQRCSNHLTLKAFCASLRKATAVEAATQEML